MLLRLTVFLFFITAHLFGEDLFSSLEHATISIYIVDSKTGKVITDRNSDLSLIPASCMKIATTGAALHLLEPESCFETHLEYDGEIDDANILHGNLYIRGGGDPCLGSDRCLDSLSWEAQIQAWADATRQLGIKKIEGKILADTSRWEKAMVAPSWEWEDLAIDYGAGASALSFHENCYSLFLHPADKLGDQALILRSIPFVKDITLYNEVQTGSKDSKCEVAIYGSEFSPIQFIRGNIPFSKKEFAIQAVIPDPAACCTYLLTQELEKRNIEVGKKQIRPQEKTAFYTTFSPKIKEIVFWTNQKSVNLYAEHLLKKMGEVVYNEGSTSAGVRAVRDFWSCQGIDLQGFHMADGSGLSRKNLMTAKQLVEILLKMKDCPLFFESLPQKIGEVRGKSGSMSFIRCYAGYAKELVFAVLVNQYPDSKKLNETMNLFLSSLNQNIQ